MSASFNDPKAEEPKRVLFKESKMSHREREVAQLVVDGYSNKEVSAKLFITEKTVKFHLTNIYKKVRVKSRFQLQVLAMKYMAGETWIMPDLAKGADR